MNRNGPLIAFGDFNEILSVHEKEGGACRNERDIDAFRGCLDDCWLMDLGYRGCSFTWSRGLNQYTVIRERLDRFVATAIWQEIFSSYEVRHFTIYKFDHAPILLSTHSNQKEQGDHKIFRFESLWLSNEECKKVVASAWKECLGEEIDFRIENCATHLAEWAESTFGLLRKKVSESEKKLKAAQRCTPDANMIANCCALSSELDALNQQEESYWHIRSRVNELRDGDKNSKYFHHKASSRKRRNTIKGLLDEAGVLKTSSANLERLIVAYYDRLFATSSPSGFEEALAGLGTKVMEQMNDVLIIPGRSITDNALIAFETFHAMKRTTNGRNNSFALKLDMSNAYNSVEWGFLERVMLRLGFKDSWVQKIMSCITSVSFSFKINGKIQGNVTSTRGLRQGDPISPYLFIICADAFSTLISRGIDQRRIHGVRVCRGAPPLSHLFFGDDSILFAKANVRECSEIANILSTYERASGQRVNLDKTEILFSKGVPTSQRQAILDVLQVNEVDRHTKYLGLPTIIGRSKKTIFSCLKERIWKKL